ncbi:MAG: inositol monophosphatase [Spirochaetales bacterium]
MENYQKDLKFLLRLVKHSNRIIKTTNVEVKDKGENDLVTNCDLAVEKYIIGEINKHYPNVPIVSEEFNSKAVLSSECFTIDPIDGTVNFANGLPAWSIQIAYRKNNETVVGVIYIPTLNELYYAVKGQGAYLNNKRIFVKAKEISKSLFIIDATTSQEQRQAIMDEINKYTRHERRIGSASSSFSFLANGNIQGVAFLIDSPWDVEPGKLIAKEAGAKIYEKEHSLTIAASSEEFLQIMKDVVEKTL